MSHPQLFAPHLYALLSFLPVLIIPSADLGLTPTVARPFQGRRVLHSHRHRTGGPVDDEDLEEEAEEVRKSALEFMISLSEAKLAMVRRTDGWVSAIVRGRLGGMGELQENELASWLDADVSVHLNLTIGLLLMVYSWQPAEDPTGDTYLHMNSCSTARVRSGRKGVTLRRC